MNISRRGFLKLIGSLTASGIAVPAFAKQRNPYVSRGEAVSWVGHCPGGFIGSQIVVEIGDWDDVGFPVVCCNGSYRKDAELERHYDFDLSDLNRDVPKGFWSMVGSKKYPNVHTYVREQRFGETVVEAMKHLNFVSFRP